MRINAFLAPAIRVTHSQYLTFYTTLVSAYLYLCLLPLSFCSCLSFFYLKRLLSCYTFSSVPTSDIPLVPTVSRLPPYATTTAKLLTQLPPELWAYQQFFMLPVGSLWFITVPKKKGLKGSHCSPKTPSLSFWDSEFWPQSWSFLAPHRAKSKESGSGMSNNSLN